MNLNEYMALEDSSEFWWLSSGPGTHKNLLDEAIERIEKLEYNYSEDIQCLREDIADITKQRDDAIRLLDLMMVCIAQFFTDDPEENEKQIKLLEQYQALKQEIGEE